MKISLENEQYIKRLVDSGEYKDPTAVLNEALLFLREVIRRRETLRKQIEEGMNSGLGIPAEVVFAEMEAFAKKLASRDQPDQ